ncbi:MAG: dihydroneopterin aldolase [Actinomycetota bacterium]
MNDRIVVRDLRVPTHIGATEQERATLQEVVVQLEIGIDLRSAGTTDDLTETLDYATVVHEVAALVAAANVRLLENLAEHVAALVLAMSGVRSVVVEVAKASVPVPQDVGTVAVRIERRKT